MKPVLPLLAALSCLVAASAAPAAAAQDPWLTVVLTEAEGAAGYMVPQVNISMPADTGSFLRDEVEEIIVSWAHTADVYPDAVEVQSVATAVLDSAGAAPGSKTNICFETWCAQVFVRP